MLVSFIIICLILLEIVPSSDCHMVHNHLECVHAKTRNKHFAVFNSLKNRKLITALNTGTCY